MMQQYQEAKAACGDALLLFRMGDFYELFHDDAKTAARVLGLTLTSREKGENAIPMAGFPHHQLDGYLGKLIKQGLRVAVCDQVEDPRQAKGLVKREITRVVTAGTLTDEALLDPRESNFLASVVVASSGATRSGDRGGSPTLGGDEAGIAWVELSTGRFFAGRFAAPRLADHLARIQPSECIVPEGADPVPEHLRESIVITSRPAWCYSAQTAADALRKHFGTAGLSGFGFDDDDTVAVRAAGAVLEYLLETQKASLDHIDRLVRFHDGQSLEIDEATRRSLEITRTIRDGRREGTLLAVLDQTVTPMGSRMLADWLTNPLTEVAAIDRRLDAVDELFQDPALCRDLADSLRGIYDMERLLARVTTGRASPRDLSFIARTLRGLPHVKAKITGRQGERLRQLESALDLCPELRSRLEAALVEDCPLSSRDGGFIRSGYSEPLDELRQLTSGGREWIARYQADQVQNSGIPNLKVGYNKVFGYYIEVTNAHRDKVPDHFIRKQTLKNAERYVTPELKEYEEKVLTAEEKSQQLEYDLFVELRAVVHGAARRLKTTAAVLAELDVLVSLASLARERNYCRPQPVNEPVLSIVDGRHPVLDVLEPEGTFVPNDTTANPDDGMILIITGPNMAGKSTYIRQVALITLMAQMGSFVPAREATIGVADRVFARVGASDELARGQSTFMVEMTETARILNNASLRSLVILDEIGRGTSTYDGLSLAWSIVEHLHDSVGCRTLFATHYHELTDLEYSLGGLKNLNVAVQEWEDTVVFLHKIVPGAADKSYGIHVARLAGVPKEVNERAKQVLSLLEEEHLDRAGRPKIANREKRRSGDLQLTLFGFEEHPVLDKIREANVDELTPLAALQLIQKWQGELAKRS
jgi:DNA mismatch repair protein MutS